MSNLGKIGFVGRFKPLHNGGYVLLEEACKQAEHVLIGIGSSNKYNVRNPFTAQESEGMIRAALSNFSNLQTLYVPDFAQIPGNEDGQEWREYVKKEFGALDYFVSGNEFVRGLLRHDYRLLHPYEIISEEKRVKLMATEVRVEIARYGNWKKMVPEKVAAYLEDRGIIERFRREFGIQTLAFLLDDTNSMGDACIEQLHARMS
jgi:cytidyltransferase-like protein